MGEPFAKLFDTQWGQLLAFKTDDGEGGPAIRVIAEAGPGGHQPAAMMSGWKDGAKACNIEFDALDQDKAEALASRLHDLVLSVEGNKT